MVNTRTNFYEGDLAYAVRVLSEDLIPIIRVLADNKEIVSALAQSKVQDWNKVLVSLARDPGKWSTIKWRNPQLRQEEMLDNDKKLWVEKVVSFINYVQNEHGGKVIHTVDLSNSTYAHFLSANSAQSSSAGDQALKAAVYELPSGTPCLGLSCRALNNTPVIPITDKYVSKLPTRDTISTQIKYVHGDDSITVPSTVTDSYDTSGNASSTGGNNSSTFRGNSTQLTGFQRDYLPKDIYQQMSTAAQKPWMSLPTTAREMIIIYRS